MYILVVIMHVMRQRIQNIVALGIIVVHRLASLMSTQLASRKYAILLTPIQVIINLQFIVAVGKQVEYKFAIWQIYLCRSFPYILHAHITFQKPSTRYMQRGLGLS